MYENDFRNRIDRALWNLTQSLGVSVVSVDDQGLIQFDQGAVRDIHMIRSLWPQVADGDPASEDHGCASNLLARCESASVRDIPPARLSRVIRDALAEA